MKMHCNVCNKYGKFENLKYHIFLKRPLKYIFKDLSIAYSKCGKEH